MNLIMLSSTLVFHGRIIVLLEKIVFSLLFEWFFFDFFPFSSLFSYFSPLFFLPALNFFPPALHFLPHQCYLAFNSPPRRGGEFGTIYTPEYFVWPPSASMTACILCGMDLWRDCSYLGWCCFWPYVQFSWQIHFEPVVFFWLPFLNGLSYRVLVALDCKIIRCRLRISHNKISFIDISSGNGWICLAT